MVRNKLKNDLKKNNTYLYIIIHFIIYNLM